MMITHENILTALPGETSLGNIKFGIVNNVMDLWSVIYGNPV